MSEIILNKDFKNKNAPQYLKEFETFYDTWLMNKYIGGGIKNFRYYCHERPNVDKNAKFICNMHPHNYYLEILTETGILGMFIVLSIFIIIFYLSFVKKYFLNSPLNNNHIIIPFIFLFIAEVFPIKSTGSFFTTGNTSYLFLIIGILIGLIRKKNIIENKI
jgi:O-antigen ligase